MPKSKTSARREHPKLGQNFLADHNAAEAIVRALGDVSQSTVLEVGPGRGAITHLLAPRTQRLIAVELDRQLAPALRQEFASQPNVEVIEADILQVDFATLLASPAANAATVRVVGNLPYYITSDILLALLRAHRYFSTIVLMVQREVADRIVATPGQSNYGSLSATTQLYARVEKLFTLPPESFVPPPKVHSSVIRLMIAPRFAELGIEEVVHQTQFIAFLRTAFAQKRKTLWNNLKLQYPAEKLRTALAEANIAENARAEGLELEEMSRLWQVLTS